jgi:hypothetical protein
MALAIGLVDWRRTLTNAKVVPGAGIIFANQGIEVTGKWHCKRKQIPRIYPPEVVTRLPGTSEVEWAKTSLL